MKKNNKIKSLIVGTWKWSWIITLPITVFFYLWVINTTSSYYDFRIRYSSYLPITLESTGSLQALFLINSFKQRIFPHNTKNGEGLNKVELFIMKSDLKKLGSNPPYSGRDYVKGWISYPEGKIYPVKARYRGDSAFHWSGPKKSIKIKTKKNRLYNGLRQFNLVIPKNKKMLCNHLSYLLGKKMGLLSPESNMVEYYLNGTYMGVMVLTEQLSEQFLRRNNKMPGDLYSGEIVLRDAYPYARRELFFNTKYWEKAAINNHNPIEWNEPLKELSYSVYNEDIDKTLELIDLDSWAAFAAYMTLTHTLHVDSAHNWRLYFDPAKGRFEPVVWDPVGWTNGFKDLVSNLTNQMDIITSIILEQLHNDQDFLIAKHRIMESFFLNGDDQYLMNLIEDTSRLEASVKGDRNLHFSAVNYLEPDMVLESIKGFKKDVAERLDKIKNLYVETPPSAAYSINQKSGVIQINVDGFAPLKHLDIEYKTTVSKPTRAVISFKKNGKLISKDVTSLLTSNEKTLRLDVPLFARRRMGEPPKTPHLLTKDVFIEPATYLLELRGLKDLPLSTILTEYGDGKVFTLPRKESMEIYPLNENTNVLHIKEPIKDLSWNGEVLIDGITELRDNLTLEPGTIVRFTPGSALILRGRLHALGTKEKPVKFLPKNKNTDPWGAVVLAGEGANGSRISNAIFKSGSGLRHRMVEYSAMLSIHDVKDIVIEKTAFMNNKLVDDMVHAVYSEVTIRDSTFKNALSDALDLDYVKGSVENTHFINSGNDALDLMSSLVTVSASTMTGSGDKGISIGEGTETLIINSSIKDCVIGVQAKDHSRAYIYNVDLVGNKISIDAYKKNWQYGDGGSVKLFKSRIIGPSPTVTSDKDSMVEIFDSYLDGKTGKKKKRIRIDTSVDNNDAFKYKARLKDPYLKENEIDEFLRPLIRATDPSVRGVIENET